MKNKIISRQMYPMISPRNVPFTAVLSLFFGSTLSLLGLIFAVMGAVMLLFLFPQVDFQPGALMSADSAHARGVVLECGPTAIHIKNETIYAVAYEFEAEGEKIKGKSYSAGSGLNPGSQVDILYRKNDPTFSRIDGLRRKPVGIWAALFILFPAAGIVMISLSSVRFSRSLRVLRNGIAVIARFSRKESTSMKTNGRTVYRYYYLYQDIRGTERTAFGKTHKTEKMDASSEKVVLYDPSYPDYSLIAEILPGAAARFAEREICGVK